MESIKYISNSTGVVQFREINMETLYEFEKRTEYENHRLNINAPFLINYEKVSLKVDEKGNYLSFYRDTLVFDLDCNIK